LNNVMFSGISPENGSISVKDKRKHRIYTFAMLVLMGIGIGLVSLLLASPYLGYSGNSMFVSYFKVPLILLLNILPCVLLILLVYFISGRAWISFLFTSVLIFGMSLGNYYKIRLRSDPFIASDIAILGEAGDIVSEYTLDITGRVLITVFCFVIGLLFAVFFMRGCFKNAKARIGGIAAVLIVSVLLYSTVYTSETVYNKAANNEKINIWSTLQVFVSKGFVYPFIYSVQDAFPQPPEGYKEKDAEELLSGYQTDDIEEDKKVNVISIMLEAYSDLSEWEGLEYEVEVYEGLKKVQAESVSGNLVDNVFGGGTIDTERAFLTGYTHSEDYRKNTNSYVWYLRDQGYYTEGFHAGDGWFYNRQNVNKYLGIENYYFLESFPDSAREDSYFFPKIIEMFENRDENVPYFSYSLTYQNHGSYDTESTCETSYISPEGLSTESYNILNNYLSGIHDTSNRIADFIDYFKSVDEPVVIVIFGDHMPWLGNNNSVYNELGINIDLGTEEGFYNYYSTPYIIWANDSAKEITGNDFTGEGATISPCFLMNEVFTRCGWKGNDLFKMNDVLRSYTNVVNSTTDYFCENGVLSTDMSDEAEAFYADYENVEYYLKSNFRY